MSDIEEELQRVLRAPAIGDETFTHSVMAALPRRRLSRAKARRLSLGVAALAGGLAASVLGGPLERLAAATGGSDIAAAGVGVLATALVLPVLLAILGER